MSIAINALLTILGETEGYYNDIKCWYLVKVL